MATNKLAPDNANQFVGFVNPNIQRQGAKARALAQQRNVNMLPDPQTYAFVSGVLGDRPDQMGFSVMHPNYQNIIGRGEQGYATGMATLVGPSMQALRTVLGPAAKFLSKEALLQIERGMFNEGPLRGITPQPSFAVQPGATRPPTDLQKFQDIAKQYQKLSSKDKELADLAFTGEVTGSAVPRSEVKKLLKGNPDIAKSILNNPAFKINGYVPKSVIDDALSTRTRMKGEAPTTPGAKASEAEWKAWGEKHGVNMTVTEPKSLGITDLTTKREIRIPGGLEGKFTVPDMFWMKANNIDPAALPKEVHDKLMQKLIRTHEVANPDQVDMFNRLSFAQLSPNAPLTPNEFLAQRLRLTNMDELQALAGRVGEPGLSVTAQGQTGVQAAGRGGMGVLGTADLKNQAMLAKLILDKPEMFQIAPGETMRDVTLRVMNQVPGLGPKTASLGTPWLDLNRANTSAVDLHMIRHSYERMLDDPIVGEAFRTRMGAKLGVEPTKAAILGVPTKKVEKAAIDVIGGSSLSKMYRTKTGELNEIPGVATPEKLAFEPKQLQDFNPFYKRVVDYVDESRGANPAIELFPEQWRKWDVYRQRLEPHEFAHPDYRLLPKQSWQEMRDALAAHKQAGYTGTKPVMKEGDWRELYYGAATPAAMLGTAALAGGAMAAKNMLAPQPAPEQPNNYLAAP